MSIAKESIKIERWWYVLIGPAALLWLIFRSGLNPKRLSYPCQRAAMPVAVSWLLAVGALFAGSVVLKKFAKISAVALSVIGVFWLIATIPDYSESSNRDFGPYPNWEVDNPVSAVFVLDSIPPTTGSLAEGNASVPDEYLPDPAIDSLMMLLEADGVYLHKTALHPNGIVGYDNIVIIKGNFQWTSRNGTNTDRIKGVIWQILNHPDGFTGEIIVADNIQDYGYQIGADDNNSEDPDQDILDVINTFFAKGYPVYLEDWSLIRSIVVSEYSDGDYFDGYPYEDSTKISYPKFRTPSGNYYVSLRYGIWDSLTASYDSSRLCIIDFPVLKGHSLAGATVAVKNWVGVMTTAYADERYGGINPLHDDFLWNPYALVARVMEVTFPKLVIVDATWTSGRGPNYLDYLYNTKTLVASPDPLAASWYAAKFILTPVAVYPYNTDPDLVSSVYHYGLTNWTNYLADSAGLPCTMDSSEISVLNRSVLYPQFTRVTDGMPVNDGGWTFGVSWIDYDADSYPDLHINNWVYNSDEAINYLYHNNGDGTYSLVNDAEIISDGGSISSTWADYDNDCDLDAYVSCPQKLNYLYTNNGDGTFTKAATGPLGNLEEITQEADWVDYDNDNDLDLFVANHLFPGDPYDIICALYRNDSGNFTMLDNSSIGLIEDEGGSIAWCDYDNDGDMDVMWSRNEKTAVFFDNDGDGTFTQITDNEIVRLPRKYHFSPADYDNDGDLDIYTDAVYPGPPYLCENTGDGNFALVTGQDIAVDSGYWTGGYWGDYDNDGLQDLVITGHYYYEAYLNRLYHNEGNGIFSRVLTGAVAADNEPTSAAAWADHDRDGDLDLFLANVNNVNNTLYINNGNGNAWIQIKLIGTNSNRSAMGAKIRLRAMINGAPVWQLREISARGGFFVQNSLTAHFGLGDAAIIDSIKIEWPSGLVQYLVEVSVNQFMTVTEPECGDVNGDEVINIFDITYLISFLYISGPPPVMEETADVNHDGTINIFDITGLISFLYMGSAPPDCF